LAKSGSPALWPSGRPRYTEEGLRHWEELQVIDRVACIINAPEGVICLCSCWRVVKIVAACGSSYLSSQRWRRDCGSQGLRGARGQSEPLAPSLVTFLIDFALRTEPLLNQTLSVSWRFVSCINNCARRSLDAELSLSQSADGYASSLLEGWLIVCLQEMI
jgi:hypothetical protein